MSNSRLDTALFLVMALGLVAVPLLVPHPDGSALLRALGDAGHAPLFGLIALVVLRVVTLRAGSEAVGVGKTYGVAFGLAALLGIASEIAQFASSRDASFADVVRNTAGASAFLMLALAFDRSRAHALNRSRARRRGLAAGAAALLLAVGIPVASIAVAMLQRDAAMPRLCDFESRWSPRFWSLREAALHVASAPHGWTGRETPRRPRPGRVARIDFQRGTYPGFTIAETSPDWSPYETLAFEIFSECDSTVTLVLRVDDAHAYVNYGDRFNRSFAVQPGVNHVRVALSDVRAGPTNRELDLTRVRRMVLFAVRPPRRFSLFLDDVRLE